MTLFERILSHRDIEITSDFLCPDYEKNKHDPFLLPDMRKAVARLQLALKNDEKITIYGDYDIDGLTATTLMYQALKSFGFKKIDTFIPNRFTDGFGLNATAVKKIIKNGTSVLLTVDCGSSDVEAVNQASVLNADVIITDHHNISLDLPNAIAVVNPKRADSQYPFSDLSGVGVAFKLVQALQQYMPGLKPGQEKWFLDLVALGTVCDSVQLLDENRANVYWGLRVMSKTRLVGLKALMNISGLDPGQLNSRSLGFVLGPKMNAAGRLETAQYSLDMLLSRDTESATRLVYKLEEMNKRRRLEQDKIFKEASLLANQYLADSVLVLSSPEWNCGIVGIVASRILEKYRKPTFLLQEAADCSKGSARSYGDFSLSNAINSQSKIINSGGGHKLAAGVSLPTDNIGLFREGINAFYHESGLDLASQKIQLLPSADAEANLCEVNAEFMAEINALEPFGSGNPEPVLKTENLLVVEVRRMGGEGQHVKMLLSDENGCAQYFIAFNAPAAFFVAVRAKVTVWYQPTINKWHGKSSIENRILNLQRK